MSVHLNIFYNVKSMYDYLCSKKKGGKEKILPLLGSSVCLAVLTSDEGVVDGAVVDNGVVVGGSVVGSTTRDRQTLAPLLTYTSQSLNHYLASAMSQMVYCNK